MCASSGELCADARPTDGHTSPAFFSLTTAKETILNTTFVVHTSVEPAFLTWLREVYIPSIHAAGIFTRPTAARVLTRIEPDTDSIAVQATTSQRAEAEKWHNETAALLRDDLTARWPQRVMHFTTFMEIIPAE